jgi:hypothetical protein
MKKILLLGLIASFTIACSETKENAPVAEPIEITVKETPKLDLGTFNVDAANYVDNEVLVTGIVDHVCKHSGKKLLLVNDEGDVHVVAETRFDDALIGEEIELKGIVREERVDESYCLKMEENSIKSHKEGETNDEAYQQRIDMVKSYRDSMMLTNVDHLSFYSLEYVSSETKNNTVTE